MLLTFVLFVVYYGFILLVATNKPLLSMRVGDGIASIVPGMMVILLSWVITAAYAIWAKSVTTTCCLPSITICVERRSIPTCKARHANAPCDSVPPVDRPTLAFSTTGRAADEVGGRVLCRRAEVAARFQNGLALAGDWR